MAKAAMQQRTYSADGARSGTLLPTERHPREPVGG
jgi:hypothetical protein